MGSSEKFVILARRTLPMPFTIAVLLTFVTILLALFLTEMNLETNTPHFLQVLEAWEMGFWELLQFGMQMILILVLGHVLALTKFFNSVISRAVAFCNNTANAAAAVALLTVALSFFNWGLGLVFGAIFARKVGEHAIKNNIPINYPVVGAAGYAGLMVWHGGLSGTIPVTISNPGHFLETSIGVLPLSSTIFSSMNLIVSALLLISIPLGFYFIGKRSKAARVDIKQTFEDSNETSEEMIGAEKLDHSKILAYLFGLLIIGFGIYKAIFSEGINTLSFITLNYINFILFGLGILLHGNFYNYIKAISRAISGASGILIQFPIYAGIMGIMKYTGLVMVFSDFFVSISNQATFPILTFISAAVVNIFVPSGGGQWAVQGPIIIDAATRMGADMNKSIMALAYGDQLTNMIQPFWALPLLAITGLKAKDILPYTVFTMFIGMVIFLTMLILF
ncbi:MAG: short-chain fatty acid transporter [Bacteroidetes bacterium]|nr:short-chain fatty acid transporter [Bacteroidota bacterium]